MILVTGGTGLVGRHLLRALVAENKKVRAIHRESSSFEGVEDIKSKIEWVRCDVRDQEDLAKALEGVKQVYHCAAVVSYLPKDKRMMLDINVGGTKNLVDQALIANIEKLVHVSSIAAIGRVEGSNKVSEENKWAASKLNSNYALSKQLSEMEVWRGIAEGLNAAIVNPSIILGPGNYSIGTGRFFSMIDEGLKIYTPGQTGFVGVQDVVKCMCRLMEQDISGERFILNSENLTYKAVFDKIAKELGKKGPSFRLNTFMSEMAWRVESVLAKISGREPRGTKETVRLSMKSWEYQNSKIVERLNYTFEAMDRVMEKTALDYLSKKKNGRAV